MPNFRAFITRKLKILEIECLCRCFVGKIWSYHSRTRIFRLFWIPKKSLLKSSHPNFPTKKNTGIENFIIPITWNPEYNPPPRRLFSSLKFCITIVSCFSLDDTPRRNWKQWPCKILVNRDNWQHNRKKTRTIGSTHLYVHVAVPWRRGGSYFYPIPVNTFAQSRKTKDTNNFRCNKTANTKATWSSQ